MGYRWFTNVFVNLFVLILIIAAFWPLVIAKIIYDIYNWVMYRKVKKTGVTGFGRLISCEHSQSFNIIYSRVVTEYDPIIEFDYGGKRYKLRAMGRFDVWPCEIGDEIAIIFSEKYPTKVVVDRDIRIFDDFFRGSLIYIVLFISPIVMLWALWVSDNV